MFSANPHPSKPAGTRFTIRKSESFLEVHPPRLESLSFAERIREGAIPFKVRLLITVALFAAVLLIQALTYSWLWWTPLLKLIAFLLGLVVWLTTPSRHTHLYFYAQQNRFKICWRSLESKARPDKIIASGFISDIQSVTVSHHLQGQNGIVQSIIIHAKETYFLDWSLTTEESLWITHEIQCWLATQKQ